MNHFNFNDICIFAEKFLRVRDQFMSANEEFGSDNNLKYVFKEFLMDYYFKLS